MFLVYALDLIATGRREFGQVLNLTLRVLSVPDGGYSVGEERYCKLIESKERVIISNIESEKLIFADLETGEGCKENMGDVFILTNVLSCLFEVDEVAHAVPHLAFCLLDKQCLAHSHQRGAKFAGDSVDVSGYESIVRGGGNDGVHSICVSFTDTKI